MAIKAGPGFNQSGTKAFVDSLIRSGLIKPGFQQIFSGRTLAEVEDYLLTKQLLTKNQLAEQYAQFYGLPFVTLDDKPISPAIAGMLPPDVAQQYGVVPYAIDGVNIFLAVGNPVSLQQGAPKAITAIRQEKGLQLHLAVAPEDQVQRAITRLKEALGQPPPPQSSPVAAGEVPAGPAVLPVNKEDLIKEIGPSNKFVDLKKLEIPKTVIERIPYQVAKKYHIIVFDSQLPKSRLEPAQIKLAVVDPNDIKTKEIISYIEQRNHVLVDQYATDEESFKKALTFYEVQDKPAIIPPKPAEVAEAPKPAVKASEAPKTVPSVEHRPPAPISTAIPSDQVKAAKAEPVMVVSAQPVGAELPTGGPRVPAATGNSDEDLSHLLDRSINTVNDLAEVIKAGLVPAILAATLTLAIKMRASDVHIEAEKDNVKIRYRVDGVLHDILRLPITFHAPLISRIKILSKLKIDEQRVPQDGRFDVVIDKRQVDLRISTMPTVYGEKVVIRLLDKSEGIKTLEQLGVTGRNFDILINSINKPFGIVLSTGPTGSGKSTTLYAVLTRISQPGVNIVTLEDPVEYELAGINQAQVKPQIGFTFAEGLRAVLRQDPNIIMVGEIRDLETAGMATQAALTGHLVLSTLHTNDAAGALPRLIDMGVEPYLITSSINCVIGQRLVRKICDNCRERIEIPAAVKSFVHKQLVETNSDQLKNLNIDQLAFYHGRGCEKCENGYLGRIGIFEVLPMSEKIEEMAVKKAPASEINAQAIREGMTTMMQDGLIKALKGITTVDEVLRVTTVSISETEDSEL